MRALLLFAFALTAGCADDSLLGAGKPCVNSSECATGLLCDFGKKPHVCATSESVSRDMAMETDDMRVPDLGDAGGAMPDLFNPNADLTGVLPPDLTAQD